MQEVKSLSGTLWESETAGRNYLKCIQICKSEPKRQQPKKRDKEGKGGNIPEAPGAKHVEEWMENSRFEKLCRSMW